MTRHTRRRGDVPTPRASDVTTPAASRADWTVIVPVLNEMDALPRLVNHLADLRRDGADILVADGGSTDGTADALRAASIPVVATPRGRAAQMNAAAAHATTPFLLFLHADTQLPTGGLAAAAAALHGGAVWGRFDVRITGTSALLPLVALGMNWRSRATRIATGDQAIFITTAAFRAVGGFPDQPLMEDIELCRRLRATHKPAALRTKVTTSGRRWDDRGQLKTIWLMWQLRHAYFTGTPATDIARRYA